MTIIIATSLHGKTVEIPDSLVLSSGEKVVSAQQWQEQRRPEILELFRSQVYGRAPLERPADLKFEIVEQRKGALDGTATLKKIRISYSGRGGQGFINLVLYVPDAVVGAAPCFLLANNRGKPSDPPQGDFWPAAEIVRRGYAAAVFQVVDLDPDKDDGFKNGVHGIFDEDGERAPDAWGTISAWAWGASRVMDYLQTDPQIDGERVAVVGHSRGGKSALWAGAQDERFALVISNDSGSTGAALSRGKKGESIAKINTTFPHWFCANYKKYNDKENELPVDQHQLLALIAPRLLYIASASLDDWSDPDAEFGAAVAATPVYEMLGLKGLPASPMPDVNQPLMQGSIGYHLREGKHNMTIYDWSRFMDFADLHWLKG